MFPVAKTALDSSMACRVFRNIKLGKTNPTLCTCHIADTSRPDPEIPDHALHTIGGTEILSQRVAVVDIRRKVEQFDHMKSVHAINGGIGAFPGRGDAHV